MKRSPNNHSKVKMRSANDRPAHPAASDRAGQSGGSRARSPIAGRKFPAEPLTPTEVQALLRACSSRASTGIRNRALIVTLWRGGLRISEALALYPKDIDAERSTLRVLHGKGDRSRTIGLDPEALAIIEKWIERRGKIGLTGRHPLFCTLRGNRVSPVYVRNLLRRIAVKVHILKRVHPHGLRHTHAFELANEGTPVHIIQQQLGHSSLATTDRYVRHLNPQAVVDAMKGRTWGTEIR